MIALTAFSSCKKFVEVPSPVTSIDGTAAFQSDAGAISIMTGVYARAATPNAGYFTSVSMCAGLSADELIAYGAGPDFIAQLYSNGLKSGSFSYFWKEFYNYIYAANEVIEGIAGPNGLTDLTKSRLLGEAKFSRALFNFYLVNLYGHIPLVTTTDYRVNISHAQNPADEVYTQIIQDLKDAEGLLGEGYTTADLKTTSTDRVRPNKWAATALLARVYLFTGDYPNAVTESSKVIGQSTLYNLETLDNAFLKDSKEAIWELQSVQNNINTYDGNLFILIAAPAYSNPVSLSNYVYNAFEAGDNRKVKWTGSLTTTGTGAATYHYSYKYKVRSPGSATIPLTENTIVMRLAEQYLIRAEANIRSGNIAQGIADLNILRNRARAAVSLAIPDPLPALSSSMTSTDALKAVEYERQVEMFTEMGDRWLTLKRMKGFTNPAISRADEIMPAITAAKGGTWNTNWQLYPLPASEIINDVSLVQNPGYN